MQFCLEKNWLSYM